jgi:hypothetical protein
VGENGPVIIPSGVTKLARRVLPPLVGTLVAAGAWALLVVVAIDFGTRARDGETAAWVFLVLAGLGAAVCLVLAFFFGRQLLVAAGVLNDYQGKRARR